MVLAPWSGQALAAFASLTKMIDTEFRELDVQLFVCDADALAHGSFKGVSVSNKGYGETYWIHEGQVLGAVTDYRGEAWKEQARWNTELVWRSSQTDLN